MHSYARHVLDDDPLDVLHDVRTHFHAVVNDLLIAPHVTAPIDAFIDIAHQRLPSNPSRWRVLYIDAAILKVLARASVRLDEDAAKACIATLDRAIVIAGAAVDETRRDHIVHDLIRRLQVTLPWRPPSHAVFVPEPYPAPPLTTTTNDVHTFAVLPSIVSAQRNWSRAPFVIRGYADDWPAMHQSHQWASPSYLYSAAGPGRIVPVEIGDDYRSDDWSQKLISWEEFLASLDPSPSAAPNHHTIYLAQHDLLAQFPRLRQDIVLPDIVYAALDSPDFAAYEPPTDVIINAWLGPKGTISPAHTDPFFNCYVQVVGRKTVWLAPPSVAAAMYPYPPGADKSHNPAANTTSPSMSNTSRVDVFLATTQNVQASQTALPLFWDTVPDKASCVTLNPGDLLFFPPGWWHAMRSEDVSFSVSMWF